MKDERKTSKKFLPTAVALGLLLTSACGMPTYHKWVYELESDCAEDGKKINVIITHDTDPREDDAQVEARSVGTDGARKIAALRAVEKYLEVTFTSGAWCHFFLSEEKGKCYTSSDRQTRAACTATRKHIGELPPSHDDGF